tara:strand:+ start:1268 stop:2350 length:1083 start_codon:yes stop_codon:yes gene_type:complete
MVRAASIGFVVSMLLTAIAAWLMSTGTVHAQRAPQHVFSGQVNNFGQPINDGFVKVTVGPGFGLQPPVQEVAYEGIRGGRYKIAVEDPTRGNYSGVILQFYVVHQGRQYQWQRTVRLEPGKVTELNFDIEGWLWHQAQPRQVGNQPGGSGGMTANQEARMEMEREQMEREAEMREKEGEERREMERDRMEREDERQREREDREAEMRQEEQESRREMEEDMRREQMELERERMERETEMREKEGEERREMERQQMERETEMREKEGEERREMQRQQMEREEDMRREQMELDRQRMERGQPGVQRVAGEGSKSGPSRGLFSNNKAGEATSGIDNIMDPTMLTIIGIALTVLTTGMTLFKGD